MTDVPDVPDLPASVPAPPPPPSSDPSSPPWHATLPDYPTDPVDPAPSERPRRLSPRSAMVVVGAVALLAASSFAVWALTRPDGADSPEAAVRSMFSAIDHEDALGVIESLPPGERKVLRDPLVDTNKELHRLGVLKSFSLDNIPGADLQVKDLKLATTDLGDGVTAVEVTGGTISGKSIPKDIPLGDPLKKILEDNGDTVDFKESTFSEDLSQSHLKLVTIKEDGGWHVSLAYSVAEAIRANEANDGDPAPVPNFGHGITPVGADTPDGAVHDLADAAVARDAAKAVALTDPQEMRALYDYAPLLLPKVARSSQQAAQDNQSVITVSKLDTTVEGDGPIRRVRITGFDVSVKDTSSSTHVTFDGRCYDVTSTATSTSTFVYARSSISGITSDPSAPSTPRTMPQMTPKTETHTEHHCAGDTATANDGSTSPFGTLGMFGSSAGEPFAITVTQVDGRWYVSPVRTVLDSLVEGLRRLQPSDLEKWGSWFGRSSSVSNSNSKSFSSVGTVIPDSGGGSTTATTIVGGTGSVGAEFFPGLSPARQQVLVRECAAKVGDAYSGEGLPLDSIDSSYYQAYADLYRCAGQHSEPRYLPCASTLDQVVAASEKGLATEVGTKLRSAQACVAAVRD